MVTNLAVLADCLISARSHSFSLYFLCFFPFLSSFNGCSFFPLVCYCLLLNVVYIATMFASWWDDGRWVFESNGGNESP